MCTNSFYVYNKYAHKRLLVPCGHCPACLQAKANRRATRIRNHSSKDKVCFFVTLTYSNASVPYFKMDDLRKFESQFFENPESVDPIPIYRDFDYRKRKSFGYNRFSVDKPLTFVEPDFLKQYLYRNFGSEGFGHLPSLTKKRDCVGAIYYKDVQNFLKRLRINLQRKYNYYDEISYFASSEYGGTFKRPHFHLLIFCQRDSWKHVKSAIIESWPYGDMLRADKRVQFSKDASSYVASYVNSSASLPKVLQIRAIREKHSMSKNFGCGVSDFSLNSILEKVESRDMSYHRRVSLNGVPVLVALPIPQYVINRYFPKFTGYSRTPDPEISLLLRLPEYLLFHRYGRFLEREVLDKFPSTIFGDYPPDEVHAFIVRISNCFRKYHQTTGRNIYDYSIDYVRTWNAYQSYVLRKSYEFKDMAFEDFYENIKDFVDGNIRALTLPKYANYCLDPNEREDIVQTSRELTDLFFKKDKTRKINGFVLESVYDDF